MLPADQPRPLRGRQSVQAMCSRFFLDQFRNPLAFGDALFLRDLHEFDLCFRIQVNRYLSHEITLLVEHNLAYMWTCSLSKRLGLHRGQDENAEVEVLKL